MIEKVFSSFLPVKLDVTMTYAIMKLGKSLLHISLKTTPELVKTLILPAYNWNEIFCWKRVQWVTNWQKSAQFWAIIQTALHVNLLLSIYHSLIFTLTLNEGILGRPARIPRNEPEEPNILEPSNSELNDVRAAGADDDEPAAIAAAAAELLSPADVERAEVPLFSDSLLLALFDCESSEILKLCSKDELLRTTN